MHAVGETPGDPPEKGAVEFLIDQRDLGDGARRLSVEGDLDLASAPSLKWALADALSGGANQIVLDLANVTFIDSTALGVLVGAQRALPAGTRLAIACAQENVLRIFEMTGLDGMFEILPTVEEALELVRSSAAAAG